MRLKYPVIISVVVLAGVLEIFWVRHVWENQANRLAGRDVALGLSLQFSSDARFRELRVLGYTGQAGIVGVNGRFTVGGSVASTNDWVEARRIVIAMNPPGRLIYSVAVKQKIPGKLKAKN
ncbi:MAG: hypothetical protein JWR19_1136 [Pedosphaera sp.]|nr:hypothetical protein [Pedosphaera sp.]